MNKNAIKEYAIWARRELIDRVSQKAFEYSIEKDHIESVSGDVVKGIVLNNEQKTQRQALVTTINTKGFDQVMEEVAYTWFNRFIALRFMEVNNYLPQKVRPFTDEENKFNPQLITDALDLDFVDKNTIYSYKDKNDTDGLYKYLLISLCNDMNQYLPGMFTKIDNYTTLLFPDNLLRDGSVLSRLISDIDEDSWNDQVQIIGWLYQFYNTEPKDKVYARKSGTKIKKEEIPAVTQLFTPDWIVKYMTENSLGRLWLDGHPNDEMKASFKYYLDEAKQEPEVEKELEKIRVEHSHITPEEIKFIDPCMGSGHILVYAFDVLMKIYESQGYTQRDAASLILKNNIYGLDIDERAYQLSYFALMMKARQYSRRIFNEHIELNVMDIKESNGINYKTLDKFKELKPLAIKLVDLFKDAKEYGSILIVDFTSQQLDQLESRLEEIYSNIGFGDLFDNQDTEDLYTLMKPLIKQARIMSQKYDTVVTNPPYNPVSNCSGQIQDFAKKHYPDSKADFFAIFMEKADSLLKKNAYYGMINMHSWMFLSSYESLREKLLSTNVIINMAHLGTRAFEEIGGEVVQTTAFVMQKVSIGKYLGVYSRLVEPNSQDAKKDVFLNGEQRFTASQDIFDRIPGRPCAYWVSKAFIENFLHSNPLGETRKGMVTADNPRFIRAWTEVNHRKIGFDFSSRDEAKHSQRKWFPYVKGGEFRKWYGNIDWVVNWENDGAELLNMKNEGYKVGSTNHNLPFIFKPAVCWTKISSSFSARIVERGFLLDDASPFISVLSEQNRLICLGLYNSPVCQSYLDLMNPTMNFSPGTISNIPYLDCGSEKEIICEKVRLCVGISMEDWNSYETSWDFEEHPLLKNKVDTIKKAYTLWKSECNERFKQLKENEEELNRIFIDIYGLQDELTPEVGDKDVTVHYVVDRKEDIPESFKGSNYVRTKQDEIKSFISYAVGCMFGRYSLDTKGLACAGGEWDSSKYSTFIPDKDNIIPISDDEFFEDDVTGRFINFVETVYGKDTLEENLQFIADALGGKGTSRQIIRNYFVNQFFIDHCNTYQVTGSGKRPIYWLFDSGKKNGFKALIYMHRYTSDLLAKMRTDYVHEQQERYRTQIENLESEVLHLSGSDKIKAEKTLTKYKDQLIETSKFEEKLHHLADQMISIDLDDGFKQNYPKFEDVVAKVK